MITKEQGSKNIPVKLYFYPVSVEAVFQKNFKFQIAIFRSSTDENGKKVIKIDKTVPMKFTNAQEKIKLSNTLSILTTIPFDSLSQRFQNKEVEFQMALEIDGNKSRIGEKINLREVLESKVKSGKFGSKQGEVTLLYKAEVKFQEEQKLDNGIAQAKRKIIRFDEDSKEGREELKEKNNEVGRKINHHKTIAPNVRNDMHEDKGEELKNKDQKVLKCKSLHNQDTHNSQIHSDNASIEGILAKRQGEDRYKESMALCAALEVEKKGLERKLKEKDSKISELVEQMEELQKRVEFDAKSDRSAKQLLKKEQSAKYSLEKQVLELKEEVKNCKKEIERLSKTAICYQQSSNNIAVGSEVQIKSLKEKIRQLQKDEYESNSEAEKYYSKLKDKEDFISQLKTKILVLEKENLELRQRTKQAEKKLDAQRQDYELELQELRATLQETKQENKTLKLPSCRDIKEDTGELRKKVETLEKQLERKEELLKKLTEMKKNSQQDISSENSTLKKQNSELKDMIDKLQSKRSQQLSSSSSIEYRVQMQKMKKELELAKKNEKALLIEKGKVETSSKQLQEDLIRGKQTIVNILNLVQDTGNDKLITEAYALME